MSKKVRVKRKYNPMRHKQKAFQKQLSKVWLAKCSGFRDELWRGGIDYDSPDVDLFCDYLLYRPHKWSVMIAIFQRDGHKTWVNREIFDLDQPVKADDIADALSERMAALHASQNKKFIQSSGWYARPTQDVDIEEIYPFIEAMFAERGAFGEPPDEDKQAVERIEAKRKTRNDRMFGSWKNRTALPSQAGL